MAHDQPPPDWDSVRPGCGSPLLSTLGLIGWMCLAGWITYELVGR